VDATGRIEQDRFYSKATKALALVLVLAIVGFAAFYYLDRYHADRTPIVDQEVARLWQMVANDPSNPQTRVALATLLMHKEAYADAIAQYGEALKLDENNATALAGLGLAYFRSGKPKEAAAAFERVIELTKDNPPAQRTPAMATVHHYLGRIYATEGDLKRAEEQFSKALSIKRSDADTIYYLAQVVAQQGRNGEAIELYKAATALVPNYAEAYEGLAKAYAASGLTVEASYAGAMVDYSRGNYDAAISRLQGVIQAKPDFGEAYYGLGAAYDKKGEEQKAIEAYQMALRYQPDNEAARVSLLRLGVKPPVNVTPAAGH